MQRNSNAIQVAKDVVDQTHVVHDICDQVLRCPDCQLRFTLPVTGFCGHTRCYNCIEQKPTCFCGCLVPMPMHPNILLQKITDKIIRPQICQAESEAELSPVSTIACGSQRRPKDRCRHEPYNIVHNNNSTSSHNRRQIPNIESVDQLLRYMEQKQLVRELYQDVRSRCISFALTPVDLECSICLQLLNDPVTTPCGHTFCRECILLTLIAAVHGDMQRQCAFCRTPLDYLSIVLTSENSFVASLIMTVAPSARVPSMPRRKWMPIFKYIKALPTVPCRVLIHDPPHCEIIKRILASGKRRIGMLTAIRNNRVTGTIVEVRDCLELRNGHLFISAIGIKRFQAQGTQYDGAFIACVTEIDDDAPVQPTETLQLLRDQIIFKVRRWLAMLDNATFTDVMYAHGPMPELRHVEDRSTDDYKWLWWMIAILPLSPKIEMLVTIGDSLFERMTAVSIFLDLVLSRQMMKESN